MVCPLHPCACACGFLICLLPVVLQVSARFCTALVQHQVEQQPPRLVLSCSTEHELLLRAARRSAANTARDGMLLVRVFVCVRVCDSMCVSTMVGDGSRHQLIIYGTLSLPVSVRGSLC